MATQEQIEEVSKEASAALAVGMEVYEERDRLRREFLPSEKPGPTMTELKAAIREFAAIARSHSPMMQDARVAELLALAD